MAYSAHYVKIAAGLGKRLRHVFSDLLRNRLFKAVVAILLLALAAAIGVTLVERGENTQFDRLGSGLWWAVVTMTTCGYGDKVPLTTAGRIIGAVVMISGVVLLSVFTAAVSSSVITRRMMEGRGLSKLSVKNHVAMLGWNSGCDAVVHSLRDNLIREDRTLVLVNQLPSDEVEAVKARHRELSIKYVYGDFTDESVLQRANIVAASAVMILPDESNPARAKSDERTILATLEVKAAAPKVRVIAHLMDPQNQGHLERANADEIVISDRFSGYLLGAHVTAPGIPQLLDSLLSEACPVGLLRAKLPHSLIGKTFSQASDHYRTLEQCLLLGFIQEEAGFKLDDILSDDVSAIDRFIREKLQAAGKGLARRSGLNVQLLPPADYVITENDIPVLLARTERS